MTFSKVWHIARFNSNHRLVSYDVRSQQTSSMFFRRRPKPVHDSKGQTESEKLTHALGRHKSLLWCQKHRFLHIRGWRLVTALLGPSSSSASFTSSCRSSPSGVIANETRLSPQALACSRTLTTAKAHPALRSLCLNTVHVWKRRSKTLAIIFPETSSSLMSVPTRVFRRAGRHVLKGGSCRRD